MLKMAFKKLKLTFLIDKLNLKYQCFIKIIDFQKLIMPFDQLLTIFLSSISLDFELRFFIKLIKSIAFQSFLL